MTQRFGGIIGALAAACTSAYLVTAPAGAQERIAVLTEPGTPVVAVEILIAVGPADEGSGREGLANLAGRAILAEIGPSLDSLGVHTGLIAEKDALSFTLIAAPDVWEAATALTLETIYGRSPSAEVVLRERAAIETELRGRLANPADAATRELDRAFYGAEHPWGRPTVGTPESVLRLTAGQVATFMAVTFTPDRTWIAVVGPIEEAEARAHLLPALIGARRIGSGVDPFESEREPVLRNYDSITSWVSASYPFTDQADEEAIRFATFLTADALSYSPVQRSVYNLWSEVVPRVGGGEVRIQIVVPPEEAAGWADRLRGFVTGLATVEMHDDVFEANLRRYRGARVMALASPEARARAAARRLFIGENAGAVMPEITDMTLSRLRSAASQLQTPTLVILGPTSALD